MRERRMAGLALLVSGLILGVALAAQAAQAAQKQADQERVIKIVAQRFSYTPREIVLRKGQPVVLEFKSLDFMHGFNIPDLKIRADLPPGEITRVRLTPEQSGTYEFLCDNFCGAGHEQMNGKIIVKD